MNKPLTFKSCLIVLILNQIQIIISNHRSMNANLGHSVLTSKTNNDMMTAQNITRSFRGNQKFPIAKDQKVSFELEYMRFQEQYRRETLSWEEQVNQLRLELERHQEHINQAQNRQIQYKQELNTMHKENLKLFQQNQKHKKLVNTLKSDNQALQLQIERWKSDRKTYSSKLDSIYQLKKNINIQISQKNTLIEEQQFKIRQNDKKLNEYKLKTQELSATLLEKERQSKELTNQVRNHLQSFLETHNQVDKFQHELHQTNELNLTLRDKIVQLQREKQILLQRIYNMGGDKTDRSDQRGSNQDNEENPYFNSQVKNARRQSKNQSPQLQNIISPTDERLMLQIQSFMREFEGLLDKKAQQRQMGLEQIEKVVNAAECLEKNL